MHLGIWTPVVNLNPRFDSADWELRGGMDDVLAVAEAADGLGYKWLGCPEHVAVPQRAVGVAGGRYWDPLVTLSYVAARTRSIELMPHVLVLGLHHPLAIVKSYGSLDTASGGRVILGVGVGSLKGELKLLGAPLDGRGDAADDALRAVKASFALEMPEYEGTHFSFSNFVVEPSGLRRDVPVWVGGRTLRSLRRALELGDGWIPFGLGLEELRAMLSDDRVADGLERRSSFEIVLSPEPPLDPLEDPEGAAARVRDYEQVGATGLALRFRHDSRAHYVEQLEAMVEIVPQTRG